MPIQMKWQLLSAKITPSTLCLVKKWPKKRPFNEEYVAPRGDIRAASQSAWLTSCGPRAGAPSSGDAAPVAESGRSGSRWAREGAAGGGMAAAGGGMASAAGRWAGGDGRSHCVMFVVRLKKYGLLCAASKPSTHPAGGKAGVAAADAAGAADMSALAGASRCICARCRVNASLAASVPLATAAAERSSIGRRVVMKVRSLNMIPGANSNKVLV